MFELMLPFGLPRMEPVDCHPAIGADNAWQHLLKYARCCMDTWSSDDDVIFYFMIRIIEEADICDHFFDKRTWLPVERLDSYELR